MSLWYVINIKNGEYQDIFYTIMITNWMMGLLFYCHLFHFFLKKCLKYHQKIICILIYFLIFLQNKRQPKLTLNTLILKSINF